MSVLFPFLSLPSKIPLNTSPKAPLPNKLEDKKHKKNVSVSIQLTLNYSKNRKKERKRRYFPRNHSRVDLNLGLVYLYYRPFQQPMAVPTVVWIALGEYIL